MPNLSEALDKLLTLKEEISYRASELNAMREKLKNLELSILCAMEDSGFEIITSGYKVFVSTEKRDGGGDVRKLLEVFDLPSKEGLERIQVKEI